MTAAKQGDSVVIDYIVRTTDGRVIGSTQREGPQTFTIGKAELFPAIDAALDGMSVGEETTVTIPCSEAFGPRRDEMVVEIPLEQLPKDQAPQTGLQLTAKMQDGSDINLIITEVGESAVTADGNHPLAGQDLHFGVTLVEIKDAA